VGGVGHPQHTQTTVAIEIKITCADCMSVAVLNQHAKRTCRIILSSLICPAVPFFPHYFINDTTFEKNLMPEAFPIIRKSERDIIINVLTYSCKVPIILMEY
jgi:hypothetical protein